MSQKPLCLVRSSINIDETFGVPHIVRPGETISSSSLKSRPGGKGANVSAAVGLAGQHVVLSGAVGLDAPWPCDELEKRNVDISAVLKLKDVPTGRAFIQIAQEDGENSIVLLKGANFHADSEADDPARVFAKAPRTPTHLIVQNEIPLQTTKRFLAYARKQPGTTTVFNPSPMLTSEELASFAWTDVDVLIVNEGEASDLVAALSSDSTPSKTEKSPLDALEPLIDSRWIIMTKGAHGVSARVRCSSSSQGEQQQEAGTGRTHFEIPPAKPKQVVDTTGAGDTFAGNVVAAMMARSTKDDVEEKDVKEILQWAVAAAAMAVEKQGAMESIPRHEDVLARQQQQQP